MRLTCGLQGGLGNQLFQILATLEYAHRNNMPIFFLSHEKSGGGRPVYWDTLFKQLRPYLISPKQSFANIVYYYEPVFEYSEIKFPSHQPEVGCLIGYFQSYRYFSTSVLYWIFPFLRIEKPLSVSETIVSIHFRYGDYEKLTNIYVPLSNTDYYSQAIAWMRDHIEANLTFWVFYQQEYDTDEKREFRTSLFQEGDRLLNFTTGEEESLIKMSTCRHHIIANSTFSWWGAYLSTQQIYSCPSPPQIVYPLAWFQPTVGKSIQDLIPPTWVGIE
jgi:hypothetical protein